MLCEFFLYKSRFEAKSVVIVSSLEFNKNLFEQKEFALKRKLSDL